MKKIINLLIVAGLVLTLGLQSCNQESWLEPTLATAKSYETGIKSQEDVWGLLLGAYDRMTAVPYYGRDFIIYGEVRSDNCFSNGNSGRFVAVSQRTMTADDGYAAGTWAQIYRVIANANIVIAQDPDKLSGDKDLIREYIGQAYAIRALAHFDLLKLYGEQHVKGGEQNLGIPYITKYKGGDLYPARNTVQEDKEMIYKDLDEALKYMKPEYNDPSKEYITTWAVYALKSRVAIYFGDWQIAKDAAEQVINSGEYKICDADQFAATFSKKGTENVIFELAERATDNNGINGLSYIYRGKNYGDIQVVDSFKDIFDSTDVRGLGGGAIAYDDQGKLRNIVKYPSNPNFDYDIPIIRYEEVILNYAEALYHLGQTAEALKYLNMIPAHRDAHLYTGINEDTILLERRKELAFEGFRFDDLARTHHSVPVYNTAGILEKTLPYGDYRYAFPIPREEINANKNMVQNLGY